MRNLVVFAVVFYVTYVVASEEIYDGINDSMKATCWDGFNSCRDFLTNKRCFNKSLWKRSTRADDMGPFWANRGKKDPMYSSSRLFAEEPHWELVRRDDTTNIDPYFTTRGKKFLGADTGINRDRRVPTAQKIFVDSASPFLAARGKKHAKTSTFIE